MGASKGLGAGNSSPESVDLERQESIGGEPAPATEDRSARWGEESGSFGRWLRRQREGRGIELEEIAEESKISLGYLRAFEEDRFEILPASVFAKGFLRQYAGYVGLDPQEVINFYLSACQSAGGEEELIEPVEEPRGGVSWRLVGVALVAILLCALVVWGLTTWNQVSSVPAVADTELARAAQVAPRAVSESPVGLAAEASSSADSPEAEEADPTFLDVDPAIRAEGAPGQASEPEAEELGRLSAQPEARAAAEAGASSSDPAGSASPIWVTLDFSGECWVEASVDGERQVAENKIQGESLLLQAATTVEITIGNIDAVQVEVNGQPFEFAKVRGTKVRTQRIDLETVQALASLRE